MSRVRAWWRPTATSSRTRTDPTPACGGIGFSRTGGGTINVTGADADLPIGRNDPEPGQRHDDLHAGAELVRPARPARRPRRANEAGVAPAMRSSRASQADRGHGARARRRPAPTDDPDNRAATSPATAAVSPDTTGCLSPGLYPGRARDRQPGDCLSAARGSIGSVAEACSVDGRASVISIAGFAGDSN